MTVPLVEADLGPRVRAAFTLAHDDAGTYDLSLVTAPDAARVLARRAALAAWAGAPVALARQVHGRAVHVCAPGDDVAPEGSAVAADAVVVAGSHTAAAVLVADCVPVLLADEEAGVVAAVHAGRRGVVAGVVDAALDAMARAGARRPRAVVGPAICGRCYEVPADLQRDVTAVEPTAEATTRRGTPALDLPAAVRTQLTRRGVAVSTGGHGCTLEDERWFSHRGAGPGRPEGRLAAVVRLLPPDEAVPTRGRVGPGRARPLG